MNVNEMIINEMSKMFILINDEFKPVCNVDVKSGITMHYKNIQNEEHRQFYRDVGKQLVNCEYDDTYYSTLRGESVNISSNQGTYWSLVIDVQIYRECLVFSIIKLRRGIPRLLIVGINIILHSAECFRTSLEEVNCKELLEEQKKIIKEGRIVPKAVKDLIVNGGLFIGIDDRPTPFAQLN